MKKDKIEVLVVGAGGVGAYFSGRLAQAGIKVSVVCRSDYQAVKKHGFSINSIHGDFKFIPENVYHQVDEFKGSADYIIVAVKALPDIDVAELISPAVKKQTAIIMLQNGIEIENRVKQTYPENELISGIAYIGVFREGQGNIRHQGSGMIKLGLYPSGISPKLQQLGHLFKLAGVDCQLTDDIIMKRWEKLLWNVPFNAISVIAGNLNTREIMADEGLVDLAENLMRDVVKTAHAVGVELDEKLIEWNIEYTRNFPPYKTSMLLDYENRRPMEIEAILGNVIRLAEQRRIKVPFIKTAFALLDTLNKRNLNT